jgi:asparagine N-glycosylation enzyme membrane subunit Stt3
MKKQSSLQVSEKVIIYLIAAVLLTAVMVLAFVGWQGQ